MSDQSSKMKKIWEDCAIIGAAIKVHKQDVFGIYRRIKDEGKLDGCLHGNADDLVTVKSWLDDISRRIGRISDEHDVDSPDAIRIALWFIKKIGSPDRAIKAIQAACAAVKRLEP